MGGFKTFGTSIVFPPSIDSRVRSVGVRNLWRADTTADPTRQFWCDEDGLRRWHSAPVDDDKVRGLVPARQLLVHARTADTVEAVVSLVHCGCLAAYPDLERNHETALVYELDDPRWAGGPHSPIDPVQCWDQVDMGVRAAAAAWSDSGAMYALLKYRFSLERDWFTPHSAAPIHRDIFAYKYDDPRSQVDAAFSIVAAYSVIEELGLEIRSSQQKPRFLPGSQWNPDVLSDLHGRLEAAGIPSTTTMAWFRRGARTKIESGISPSLGRPADWNSRYGVRDQQLSIADAIHYASWLRNKVAAHKFRALATEVSPYDVHNTQRVARRVLLGYLGLWDCLTQASSV